MTAPKAFMYRIQYVDNTYQVVDWTKAEFKEVGQALVEGQSGVMLDNGIFRLTDIRAIVFLPPAPEPTKEELKKQIDEESQLGEWTWADPEVRAWLKDQGVDLVKGGYSQ